MTEEKHIMVSTRENYTRTFEECDIVLGRGGGGVTDVEPTTQAINNMKKGARKLGCDAVIGMRLVSYQGKGPNPAIIIAYGTAIKWLKP